MTPLPRRLSGAAALAVLPILLLTGVALGEPSAAAAPKGPTSSTGDVTRWAGPASAGTKKRTPKPKPTPTVAEPTPTPTEPTPTPTSVEPTATPTPTPTTSTPSTPEETPTPMPTTTSTAPRELVWKDDFDGASGSPVDARWWTEQAGGEGWGNEELQRYQDGGRNAVHDGTGHLVITAREESAGTCWYGECRYTSARITSATKVSASSGKVEARIKLPAGTGLWPAFWMLGENVHTEGYPYCGEIDVIELVGDKPGEIWGGAHGPGYVNTGLAGAYRLPEGSSFADDFHTFAMEWTAGGLEFSVDGQVYHRVDKADIGAGNEWVFDKPMHILLNLAVGGRWPGDPAPETAFPAQMVVDYVALYR